MRPPRAHEAAPDQLLRPVDEAVGHHVERHVHLRLGHRFLHRIGDEELERAEGERVQHHPHLAHLVALAEHPLHLGRDLGALLLVGRVDVEEAGLPPEGRDLGDQALDVGQGGLAVEVDAEDVEPRARERQARGRAEAGGGAEDRGPSRAA